MNKSIEVVALNTNSEAVREVARTLFANAGRRVRVTFTKKNGDTRVMDCVPRNQFNKVLGITSTPSGVRMVQSKCDKDMITVAEVVGATLQPRTINLRTVTNIVVLGC